MCLVGSSELWCVVCLSIFNLLCCHLHLRVHDFLFYFETCPLHFLLLFSLPENFTWVLLTFPNLHIEVGAVPLCLLRMTTWCVVIHKFLKLPVSCSFFVFLSLMCACALDFFFFFFFCLCQIKFVCLDLNLCQVITFTMAVFESK